MSTISAPLQYLQSVCFDKKIKNFSLDGYPPLFILGHWRSGTTHLHYLLAKDPKFAFLTNFQTFIFNISFLSKKKVRDLTRFFIPKTRPQDNVVLSPNLPAEEEQPFCTTSSRSGILSFFFPKNLEYFNKYNVFKNITAEEKRAWQDDYMFILKGIALFNNNKNLLLKNPHNTGRVKELLELFPDAKFIFLHRDPYVVYQSTRHLFNKLVKTQFLQHLDDNELHQFVMHLSRETLQKYVDEKHLIPKGNLIEVAYTDLDENPMAVMRDIYEKLQLPGFEAASVPMKAYLETQHNYRKNKFSSLPKNVQKDIEKELSFFFEEYNYKKNAGL